MLVSLRGQLKRIQGEYSRAYGAEYSSIHNELLENDNKIDHGRGKRGSAPQRQATDLNHFDLSRFGV